MAASTQLIADTKTVITNGPTAASLALANNPNGPLIDYPGTSNALLINLEDADVLLTRISSDTDGSDPNLTNIAAVLAALNGTSSPSATVITAMKAVYTAGPTAATLAKAINANGPIMDYLGNVNGVVVMLEECYKKVTRLLLDTDASDPSKTTLTNIQTCLS